MDEMIFLGTVMVLIVAGLLLFRAFSKKKSGRSKPHHPAHRDAFSRRSSHMPASHTLLHSHSTDRVHAADDIWRSSRVRANESRWETGVVVANKILTDSELALEEREPEQGHGMSSIDYKPTDTSRSPAKSAGKRRSRR